MGDPPESSCRPIRVSCSDPSYRLKRYVTFVVGDKGMILGLVKHESLMLVAKSMNLIKKYVWICKHDVSVLNSL